MPEALATIVTIMSGTQQATILKLL